jgi:hypothetical protein
MLPLRVTSSPSVRQRDVRVLAHEGLMTVVPLIMKRLQPGSPAPLAFTGIQQP